MTTIKRWYPKAVRPYIVRGVVPQLTALRRELEDSGALAEELPALLLLADVCKALGLGPQARRAVLGQQAAEQAEAWGEVPVSLTDKNLPRIDGAGQANKQSD